MKMLFAAVAVLVMAVPVLAQSCPNCPALTRVRHVERRVYVEKKPIPPVVTMVAVAPPVVVAKPMPVAAVQTVVAVETHEPMLAFPHPVRTLMDFVHAVLHLSAQKAHALACQASGLRHRVFEIHRVREFHLFRIR